MPRQAASSACAAGAARKAGCNGFKKVTANGFAHHPYGPAGPVSARSATSSTCSAIRRLASALDKAGARRADHAAASASTTPSSAIQTNPPDPFISTTPARQAEILNEKEEFSYRYSRLKSYSQYLLYDDPARTGPPALRWAGFQTGLRYHGGAAKPSYDAYRLPIVVKKQRQRRADLGPRAARHRHPLRAAAAASAAASASNDGARRSRRTRAATSPSTAARSAPPTASTAYSDAAAQPAARHQPRGEAAEVRGRARDVASRQDPAARRARRAGGAAARPRRRDRPPRAQWSVFEDHTALVQVGADEARAARSNEIKDARAPTRCASR